MQSKVIDGRCSSHGRCSTNKALWLWNYEIFTGKQLCWSLFKTKLQAFKPATLLKRDSNRFFPEDTAKYLRTAILKN